MTQVSLYLTDGKNAHRLNGLWTTITWSGESTQVYRTLEFTLANTANGTTRKLAVNLGALVRMTRTSDGAELFRGYVFNKTITHSGEMSVTCFDAAYYLTRSEARVSYKNKTASDVLRDICKRHSLPIGSIANTGKKIKSLKFRGVSLDKIVNTALTETRQAGGKKHIVTCVKGKIGLREVPTLRLDYRISSTLNLLSSSHTINNENRRNVVRLTGGKDEAKPTIKVTAKSASTIKKYGVMAHYAHKTNVKKTKQLNTLAKALLKSLDHADETFDVTVMGNVGYRSGKRVHVTESMSARKGLYYIADDSHDFNADGTHTTNLTLTKNVQLEYENYEAPSDSAKSTATSAEASYVTATGKFTTAKYTNGWETTGYAYRAGGINGSKSGITASGTKVLEGRTIAVDPNVIPHGSIVAIWASSNKKYSGLYLAEDSGGAIKGKKIDIAMLDVAECKKWGRRKISIAIVEKGTGREDARRKASNWSAIKLKIESKMKAKAQSIKKASNAGTYATGKAAKIVAYAKTEKGKHVYTFGGKRYGIYDCSGWTHHVYAKFGINIGHGSANQAVAGRYVKQSQIQAGDLIIMKNTYRTGISHVGIAISKTQMIHQGGPNGKRGPTVASIASGSHFGGSKHYHSARRVT